jgi:DNA-binding transcriptional MerR regulator
MRRNPVERREFVRHLREDEGLPFKEIAHRLRISLVRAHQLYHWKKANERQNARQQRYRELHPRIIFPLPLAPLCWKCGIAPVKLDGLPCSHCRQILEREYDEIRARTGQQFLYLTDDAGWTRAMGRWRLRFARRTTRITQRTNLLLPDCTEFSSL